jgi:hypothetical protein
MILSVSLLAQESPIIPRAERVQINEGPEVPLVDNPGGLPALYAIVHYLLHRGIDGF